MKKLSRILSALLLIASLVIAPLCVWGCSSTSGNVTTYLSFSSDVHNDAEGSFSTRLSTWLPGVSETLGGVSFDTMGFCGDYGAWALEGDEYWAAVQKVMDAVDQSAVVKDSGFFRQGTTNTTMAI